MSSNEPVKLTSLKDLQPPLSRSKLLKQRYVKIKEPRFSNGVRVYWELQNPKHEEEEDDDSRENVPCEGFFEFVNENIVQCLKRWVDGVFGPLLGLSKHDDSYCYEFID